MKKIALSLFTCMMLFAGVFLSACGEKNISLSLSQSEVTIYTNDQQEENYKTITVSLKDSSEGIGVQLESQTDVVSVSPPTKTNSGDYSFVITALKSGNAEIRVYAKEKPSVYKILKVQSKTNLQEIHKVDLNDKERSPLFVIKAPAGEVLNKPYVFDLDAEKYFEFRPYDTNVKGLVWTFQSGTIEENSTKLIQNDQVVAEILNNEKLVVYETYNFSSVTVKASFVNNVNINETLEIECLDKLNVLSYNVGETEEDRNLIRNDSQNSSVAGQIVLNASNVNIDNLEIGDLQVEAYLKNGESYTKLSEQVQREYFSFETTPISSLNGNLVVDFLINAFDQNDGESRKLSGDLYLDFKLGYKNFDYDVNIANSFEEFIHIYTYFIPGSILVRNNYNSIAGQEIDLYSSYFTGYGYETLVNVYPDDIILNNSNFQISIEDVGGQMEANPNYYLKVYREGDFINPIVFKQSNNSSTWYSEEIKNGTKVYLQAGDGNFGTLPRFEITFIASGNGVVKESVYANLFSVDDNPNLNFYELIYDEDEGKYVENGEFDYTEVYYVSSGEESMSYDFYLRLKGYSTTTGLGEPIYKKDSNYSISYTQRGGHVDDENPKNSYIDIVVTVKINKEGYEGAINFSFEHKTGAKSEVFSLYAFSPLKDAVLTNNDIGATNVFYDKTETQSFVVEDGEIVANSDYSSNNTLSSLLVSAGSNIELELFYDNATLNVTNENAGYYFAFMDIDAFAKNNNVDENELNEIFGNLKPFNDGYVYEFTTENNTYFTYKNGILNVASEKGEFIVYVAVYFNGFDEEHNEISLVRIFRLESFYPVNSLRSNVADITLYAAENLSEEDSNELSITNVLVDLRLDKNEPTYNDLSNFTIRLKNGITKVTPKENYENTFEVDENGKIISANLNNSVIENEYVALSGFRLVQKDATSLGLNAIAFQIRAKSTQFNSSYEEIINMVYEFEFGEESQIISSLGANINIRIIQADRIEKVTWINETYSGDIYLNIASNDLSEQSFTISTSIQPDYAENKKLTYYYQTHSSNDSVIDIETVSVSQSFNLTIGNKNMGGYGTLYILPEDMVKMVEGINQIIYYEVGEDGNLNKEAQYLPLSQIDTYYDALINGTLQGENGISANYFLNNFNEKIYYKDIILKIGITVADGLSEETAIRVYSQKDLESIEPNLYYRIMNNIELSSWKSINSFQGMIFGDNEDITLTFKDNSQTFVNELSGTVKNLTMIGEVSGGGFVANEIEYGALVSNVAVDIRFVNGSYAPSVLTGGVASGNVYAGGIAGINYGTIQDCDVLGLSIELEGVNSVIGGIVGLNYNLISGSGVEFYNFSRVITSEGLEQTELYSNSFTAQTIGGLVGMGASQQNGNITIYTRIVNSFVYAHNLTKNDGDKAEGENPVLYENIFSNAGTIGAFVGSLEGMLLLRNSFAYLGDLEVLYDNFGVGISNSDEKNIRNSYITYLDIEQDTGGGYVYRLKMEYILNSSDTENTKHTINYADIGTVLYDELGFDSSIWETENIDATYNFGFAYLKNIHQNVATSVDQTIQTIEGKVVNADILNGDGTKQDAGIFFLYETVENVVGEGTKNEIANYNTISMTELFGISSLEAEGLVWNVDKSSFLNFTTNSLTAIRSNVSLGQTINLTLYSRVDFSVSKTFEILIINYIPEIVLNVGNTVIDSGQILNVQTGVNNASQVQAILDHTHYFNGQLYTLKTAGTFKYDVNFDKEQNLFTKDVIGNLIVITAHEESKENVGVGVSLTLSNLEENFDTFNSTLSTYLRKDFLVSSYNGANSLEISDHIESLSIIPQETTSFNVTINSDNDEEDLVVVFSYNGVDYEVVDGKVTINDNLVLDVTKNKVVNGTAKNFEIILNVNKEFRHKVDKTYNFTIKLNALTQRNNTSLQKTINFVVSKQNIEKVNVTTYSVESRILNNNRWYYNPSTTITSTLVPGAESILTLEISPNFAHFSKIDISYEATTTSQGKLGTVGINRLSYNSTYGYYIDSSTTDANISGITVNPTDSDLKNGVYYFRVYVSSSFTAQSKVVLTFTFYDDETKIGSYTYNYVVDFLNTAEILVDGAHSITLAKGDSAEVSITLELDQTLTENSIRLENNGNSITLSSIRDESTNEYRRYTAVVSTSVLSTLADGNSTGAFYVYASVSRYVNGILDYLESYATIYLVDFTINAEETKAVGSTQQASYNGGVYDVVYSYINAEQTLAFDYVLEPETYKYNPEDNDEYEAVRQLTAKRTEFLKNGNYRDDVSQYYINYVRNSETGLYDSLSIEDRLFYVNSNGSATNIYNSSTGEFLENSIIQFSKGANDTLKIKGLRIGSVLLRLTTTVIIGNTTFTYDYDFVIQISVWTDEEVPMPIYTAEEFLKYAKGNPDDQNNTSYGDYILMNDIVLEKYTPVSTEFFRSFDGNGYQIYIKNFNTDVSGNSLELALFSEVAEISTIKNVRVNLYNAGQLTINMGRFNSVKIAGFALENNGIIYNCEVVSYYDEELSTSRISGSTGIVTRFTRSANTDPVKLSSQDIEVGDIVVAGFVETNNNIITNSRVGGESIGTIVEGDGVNYYSELSLPAFHIQGQGTVAGFVNNNRGTISASFVRNVQIDNEMNSALSTTSGFVVANAGEIHTSYVQGERSATTAQSFYYDGSSIASTGKVAGFVYMNSGTVKNSYVNIAFEVDITKSDISAGFVYQNEADGVVTLSYAAAKMAQTDINELSFVGVNKSGSASLNYGEISYSYYYNVDRVDTTPQSKYDVGAYSITDVSLEASFYRFSFSSINNSVDGIWTFTDENVITLVSANQIAFSNRYIVYNSEDESDYFYLYSTLTDIDNYRQINLSYGSINNPIIIRNASDFAKATGKAQNTEISSYKQYYNDYEVFGNYRLVSDVDLSKIDQNLTGENALKLTTTTKTFSGVLDGNSFTISNISLGSSKVLENYGLFAKLEDAVVMNAGFEVQSVHDRASQVVGTLAGTAIDSKLIAIKLSPVQPRDEEELIQAVSIAGQNMVGGLVGVLLGDSTLNDITISNIDVESAYYYGENKGINRNSNYTGQNLREIVALGGSIGSTIRELSYAGGVVGYVDIYKGINDSYKQYSSQADVTNYDLVSIKVLDSVDIYAEVSGGLFGYLGKSTLAYDLGLEINADGALNNPSYIISKNLFAGGIVGESYAGLYAVYAKYSETLQTTIESGMLSLNAGERGQTSIFSYSVQDTKHQGHYNSPYYIGGLVGYAGAGHISVAYNSLNVSSQYRTADEQEGVLSGEYRDSRRAVAGIVGYINSEYAYDASFLTNQINISYYMNEVYFSGGLYSETNATAGGIIGEINVSDNVVLNKINSIPYYDSTKNVEKIYSLVAGFENDQANGNEFPANLYLLDARGNYHNIFGSSQLDGTARSSIAVSNQFLINNGKTSTYIYGQTTEETLKTTLGTYRPILEIGEVNVYGTIDKAHSAMASYFLQNNWDDTRWVHDSDKIFPEIVLLPKSEVIYLDASEESINATLEEIKTRTTATVVVRGRVDEDLVGMYSDIDLRGYEDPFKDFGGTLISYTRYMQDTNEGVITAGDEVTQKVGEDGESHIIGGYEGDNVGIIASEALFNNTQQGFTLDSLNIYIANEDNENKPGVTDSNEISLGSSDGAVSDSQGLLVTGRVTDATFIDLNIYINGNLNFIHNTTYMGLITGQAISTNFQNINLVFRYDEEEEPSNKLDLQGENLETKYFGILAGQIMQRSVYNSTSVSNIVIKSEQKRVASYEEPTPSDDLKFNVNIVNNDFSKNFYFGLLAGEIGLEANVGVLPISFGINNLVDDSYVGINLSIEKSDNGKDLQSLYFGGYFGKATLSEIRYNSSATPTALINNFIVHQKISVTEKMVFGLGFGELAGGGVFTFDIGEEGNSKGVDVSGGLYQFKGSKTGSSNIGGFIGVSSFNISTTALLNVNFDLLGNQEADENVDAFENYDKTTANETEVNPIYFADDYEYENGTWTDSNDKSINAEMYSVYGSVNAGVFIGQMSGGNCAVNSANFSQYCDIQVSNVSDSETNIGAIGYISGGSTNLGQSPKTSSVNYFVEANGTMNVGGFAGKVGANGENINNFSLSAYLYDGTVVAFAKTLNFGGVAGTVYASSGRIQNTIFAGTLKSYVKKMNDTRTIDNLTVGGVIASLNKGSSEIGFEDIYSIGNIFVNYESNDTDLDLLKFVSGGIVGELDTTKIKISNSYSLMTPFNDRIVENGLSADSYRINAFVGINSENATFDSNNNKRSYYSSGVTLSYQYVSDSKVLNDSAVDVSYGFKDENYYGYSSKEILADNNDGFDGLSGRINDNEDIITIIKDVIKGYSLSDSAKTNLLGESEDGNVKYGTKLNPIKVVDSGTSDEENGIVTFNNISSGTKGIAGVKWYYFAEDISIQSPNSEELSNLVIVGNGKTITYKPSIDTNGEVETKEINSGTYAPFEKFGRTPGTYNVISGILSEIEFSYNINVNNTSETYPNFAGLIDKLGASENANLVIVYAVGVRGNAEFGGKGYINFGGIVANHYKGMISNSYVDLDIFYHAGAKENSENNVTTYSPISIISAITNVQDGFADIFNTFAMGQVKSYVPAKIYTFNSYTQSPTSASRIRISDSYTVMQPELEDYGFGMNYEITNFVVSQNGTNTTKVQSTPNLYHQNFALDPKTSKLIGTGLLTQNMAIGYNELNAVEYKIDIKGGDIYSPWFYSPYRNYGYGTTGFVYLRNTTTFHRNQTNLDDIVESDKNYAYNTYSYTLLTEEELLSLNKTSGTFTLEEEKDYFFAISNVGKFRQLEGLSGKNSRFFLKYDLNISDLTNNGESWNYLDHNLGNSANVVVIDGQNHLVEFSSNVGLFGQVYANIENLRVVSYTNLTGNNSDQNYGVLAGSYTGRLINSTVQGSIEVTSATDATNYVGGIAGQFTGTIASVESLVDITVNKGANYIGGLVGSYSGDKNIDSKYGLTYEEEGKNNSITENSISYSSNNGSIVSDESTQQGSVKAGTVTVDQTNYTSLNFELNDKGLGLEVTTSHKINSNGANDISKGQKTSDGSEISSTVDLINVIGGIAGYVSSGSISNSYNNATIMNNYKNGYSKSLRNIASGGIAGYSKGAISNTINTGYVVSGNNENYGVALAGGIVGYTTVEVTTSYNDAKVQAVSEVNTNYYRIKLNKEPTSFSGDMEFTLEYNLPNVYVDGLRDGEATEYINPYEYKMPRLVHAYGIGYGDKIDGTNVNLDSSEVINDGNIGYTVRTLRYTYNVQRYAGGAFNSVDQIHERLNYKVGADSTLDFKISGYDSYGFPNRLNLYYEYSFDIQGFKHNYTTDYGNFMKFIITDSTPNSVGGSTATMQTVTENLDSIYPGGTTKRYFSIPFYSITDDGASNNGNSYQELAEGVNGWNSNILQDDGNEDDRTKDFDNLYANINSYREGKRQISTSDKEIDVNGKKYNYISAGSQYLTYVGGIGISGSVKIELPKVSGQYETSDAIENITVTPTKVDSIDFKLSKDGTEKDIQSLGSDVAIVNDGGSYILQYKVYYNKNDLGSSDALKGTTLSVNYSIVYEYSAQISLTKRNIEKYTYQNAEGANKTGLEIYVIESEQGVNNRIKLGKFLNDSYPSYYEEQKDKEGGLGFEVYFENESGKQFYYDTNSNSFKSRILVGEEYENGENALELKLVKGADDKLENYIGVFKDLEAINELENFLTHLTGDETYTMGLSYFRRGSGSYDKSLGGSQEFESAIYREIVFTQGIKDEKDFKEGEGWGSIFTIEGGTLNGGTVEIGGGNSISVSINSSAFGTFVENSKLGSVRFEINTEQSTNIGTASYSLNGSHQFSSSNKDFEITTINGDPVATGTFKDGKLTITNKLSQTIRFMFRNVGYVSGAQTVDSTYTVSKTVKIGDAEYGYNADYSIDSNLYVYNGSEYVVTNDFTLNESGGTYSIDMKENVFGSDNTASVYVKYNIPTDPSAFKATGGNIQMIGGINIDQTTNTAKVSFIVNDGFDYTKVISENGEVLDENDMYTVGGKSVAYTEMKESHGGETTSYRFYRLDGISSFHGVSVTSGNYIVTEATLPNGLLTNTLVNTANGNVVLTTLRVAEPTENKPGLEFSTKNDGNQPSYNFTEVTLSEDNEIFKRIDNSSWLYNFASLFSNYLLDKKLSGGTYLVTDNTKQVTLSYDITDFNLFANKNAVISRDYYGTTIIEDIPVEAILTENLISGQLVKNQNTLSLGGYKIDLQNLLLILPNGESKDLAEPVLNLIFDQKSKSNYTLDGGNIVDSNGNKIGYININDENDKNLYDNSGKIIGYIDENYNMIFTDLNYQGSSLVTGLDIECELTSIPDVPMSENGSYNENYEQYSISISITETDLNNYLNDLQKFLIANSIENSGNNTPIVKFTDSSLNSFAGIDDFEIMARNFGPTETIEEVGLFYGPSYYKFDVDINVTNENLSLSNSSSNKDFDLSELQGENADRYHTVSLDMDDTSIEFGDYDNDGDGFGYNFMLTATYGITPTIQGSNSATSDENASFNENELANQAIGNIILLRNLYISEMAQSISNMELRGENYLITQNLSLSVFNFALNVRDTGNVYDTNFVVLAEAENMSAKTSSNVFVLEGKTSNSAFYGTVRKIDPKSGGTLSFSVVNFGENASIERPVNVSLIGADASSAQSVWKHGSSKISDGQSVSTKLSSANDKGKIKDNDTTLVGGNGGNGSNGVDGVITDDQTKKKGADGGNGGTGGTVSGGKVSITGASGASGNGGNGGDGKNATTENIAGGGGAGGNSGDYGKDFSDNEKNAGKTNRTFKISLPGSGGSGGLGMYYNGVNDYNSEYYYKYKDNGYNVDGYLSKLSPDSGNKYTSWIKTAGGGGAAGEIGLSNGGNGLHILPNTYILKRGFNSYRGNIPSTSGYYWQYSWSGDSSGTERLFGNLQMISTFSYYGTTPFDTGPTDIALGKENHYIPSSDIVWYIWNENEAASNFISTLVNGFRVSIKIPFPWNLVGIAISVGLAIGVYEGRIALGNSQMIFGVPLDDTRMFLDNEITDLVKSLFGNNRTIIDLITDALNSLFTWMTSLQANSDVIFRRGIRYHEDGGIGDYWWLYDDNNLANRNENGNVIVGNKAYLNDMLGQFKKYLDGISKNATENESNSKDAAGIYNNNDNKWEENFYGGAGAGDGTGDKGNGGTPYTKEIYGYAKLSRTGSLGGGTKETSDPVYKCFFTRNDFVTSAGSYGDINQKKALTTANVFIA